VEKIAEGSYSTVIFLLFFHYHLKSLPVKNSLLPEYIYFHCVGLDAIGSLNLIFLLFSHLKMKKFELKFLCFTHVIL
jgi:hypothetical protein